MLCQIKMAGRRRDLQQPFGFRTWGGRRRGAGRTAARENFGLQPHVGRPKFAPSVPVHVTMRARRGVPSMRAAVVARVVVGEISRASTKGFRVLHFSVQEDHVHLIAEGDDGLSFSRGMQRLASRIAMAVNALASRHGQLWRERYYRRDLASPRQFRNALVYVTFNFRKHSPPRERAARERGLDVLSSAFWVDDWSTAAFRDRVRAYRARAGPRPTADPRTWTARVGWKRHGALDPRESPRSAAMPGRMMR